MFDKYLRAVFKEKEKRKMSALLKTRFALGVLSAICLVAAIAEGLIFTSMLEKGEAAPENVLAITFAFALVSLVSYLIIRAIFNSGFNAILKHSPAEGEPDELVLYRKKLLEERISDRDAFRKNSVFAIVGGIVFIALVIVETIISPESEKLGALGIVGFVVLVVGALQLRYDSRKRAAVTRDDACLAEKIDELQNIKHKSSVSEDIGAQDTTRLFPNPEIRERFEKAKKDYTTILRGSLLSSAVMGMILVGVVCSGKIIPINLSGYAFPILLFTVFALTLLASLQPARKLDKIEKEQLEELEAKPEYAKNLELYRKYEEYSKGKGRTMIYVAISAIIVSLAIAVPVPDRPWSVCCVLILIAGALINNRFFSDFRKGVIPLEKEIDAENAHRAKTEKTENNSMSTDDDYGLS